MSDSNPSVSNLKNKTFKPRAGVVRKSKAERDAHAKQEAEKAAVRASAASQASSRPAPSTRSSTAKKRDQSKGNRDEGQSTATGVFGTGTGTRQSGRKSVVDSGQSELLEGQHGLKPADESMSLAQETRSTAYTNQGGGESLKNVSSAKTKASKAAKAESAIQSDDELDEPGHDIEQIWVSSADEEENNIHDTEKGKMRVTSNTKMTRQGGGLRPVRAPRIFAEDLEADSERKDKRKTVKSTRTMAEETEVNEETEVMEIEEQQGADALQVKHDLPSSPELARRSKPSRKFGGKAKDSKLATETVEEKAERLRLLEDVEKLRREFVHPSHTKLDANALQHGDHSRPEGKLFLFQFPPLVPFLVDKNSISQSDADGKSQALNSAPPIKSDPDGPAASVAATTIDDSDPVKSTPKTQTAGIFTATEPLRLPSGKVGRLNIHKSGKVTLDWGGTDMEVRYGTEVDFLQDAVLVETPGQPESHEEKTSGDDLGTAYALGQVQKKMVVIPDWQKLYD